MTKEQLLAMIINERLSILLKRESSAEKQAIIEKGEGMIQSLEKEKRAMIEEYMGLITKEGAENPITAYIGGVHDGIRLMMRIYEIEREEKQQTGKNQT